MKSPQSLQRVFALHPGYGPREETLSSRPTGDVGRHLAVVVGPERELWDMEKAPTRLRLMLPSQPGLGYRDSTL